MSNTVYLDGDVTLQEFLAFAHSRALISTRYKGITLGLLDECYERCMVANLSYCRKTHVMRDDTSGVLERPSDPTEWGVCSKDAAKHSLMRHVWCDAVRLFNLEQMNDASR